MSETTRTGPAPLPRSSAKLKKAKAVPRVSGTQTFLIMYAILQYRGHKFKKMYYKACLESLVIPYSFSFKICMKMSEVINQKISNDLIQFNI